MTDAKTQRRVRYLYGGLDSYVISTATCWSVIPPESCCRSTRKQACRNIDYNMCALADPISTAAAQQEASPALTKRQRQKLKKQAEAEEEARRSQLIPKSVAELEKAVQAEPNNGYAWIQYMAQHISEGDAAQARAVAERALQTINFRCRHCWNLQQAIFALSQRTHSKHVAVQK